MGYAHKVARVTIFGEMFGSNEEWSTGFFLGAPDADAAVATTAFTGPLKTAWSTLFTTGANGFSNYFSTTGVKVARMGLNAKTELDTVVTDYYASPIFGGGSGAPHPPQIALVTTLTSGTGKGLGGKGRMYLPGVKFAVDGTGHISSTEVNTLATALKTFFDAVNGMTDAPGSTINASQGRLVAGGAGPVNKAVDGLRVGNVYDTQRRRRNQLAETYTSKTITI